MADIQRRRDEWEAREREEEAQKHREEARREEATHSTEERVAKKHARTDINDTEIDTDAGGEAGTSQSYSRHKKRHMTNIYLTDSEEEEIVDFVKDHKELYNKTNEHFKDKAMKECHWERTFTVKVCKIIVIFQKQ